MTTMLQILPSWAISPWVFHWFEARLPFSQPSIFDVCESFYSTPWSIWKRMYFASNLNLLKFLRNSVQFKNDGHVRFNHLTKLFSLLWAKKPDRVFKNLVKVENRITVFWRKKVAFALRSYHIHSININWDTELCYNWYKYLGYILSSISSFLLFFFSCPYFTAWW